MYLVYTGLTTGQAAILQSRCFKDLNISCQEVEIDISCSIFLTTLTSATTVGIYILSHKNPIDSYLMLLHMYWLSGNLEID